MRAAQDGGGAREVVGVLTEYDRDESTLGTVPHLVGENIYIIGLVFGLGLGFRI